MTDLYIYVIGGNLERPVLIRDERGNLHALVTKDLASAERHKDTARMAADVHGESVTLLHFSGGRELWGATPHVPKFVHQFTNKSVKPKPWQLELKAGDCYVIERAEALVGSLDYPNATERIEMGMVYGELLEKLEPGVFNARAYSSFCPSGEEGPVTVVEISHKISREQLETQIERLQGE